MALFDFGKLKKTYGVQVRCWNCGHTQELNIPKGNLIDNYIRTEGAVCEKCGNASLRRIEKVIVPKNADKLPGNIVEEERSPKVTVIRDPVIRNPRPVPQPVLDYPRSRPVERRRRPRPTNLEPAKSFKQPVDYWTGKPIQEEEGENYEAN